MNRNSNIRKGPPFGQSSFNPTNPQNPQNSQMRPPMRPPPFINRTIIPSREYDPLIITQLLLKASTENNLLDLKKFIMENGITTSDMLNDEGQSILHLVLLNLNLSDRQKLECVRFLRDNGTLISSFDKLNQTPLHVACRLQLKDIVLELINAGHDVNQTDSSFKTPLHYAVIGKSIEAPDMVDKKIFPKTKIKSFKSAEIPNITKNLVEFIETTPTLKQFFENQFNTFNNSHNIFKNPINDILKSSGVLEKLTEMLTNFTLDDAAKKSKIFEITNDSNKKVKEFLSSQLIMSVKQLNMKPDTENGWGPDTNSINKILEYSDTTDLKTLLNENQVTLLAKINDTQNTLETEAKSHITDINDEIGLLNTLNESLIFYHNLLNIIGNIIDRGTTNKIANIGPLLFTQQQIDENFTYNMTNLIFDKTYYSGLLTLNDLYNFATNMNGVVDISGNFVIPAGLKLNNIDDKFKKKYYDNIDVIINDLKAMVVAGTFDFNATGTPFNIGVLITANQKYQNTAGQDVYYLTRKLATIAEELTNINTNIDTDIKKLFTDIAEPNKVLSDLSDIIIHILSFVNTLPKYFAEYKKVITYYENILTNIKAKNVNKRKIKLNGNDYDINIVYDLAQEEIEFILKKMRSNQSSQKNTFYNDVKKYYELLSNCITYTNTNNACKFIEKYFNDFTNLDTTLSLAGSQIQQIFENPIEKLTDFFKSYEDMVSILILDDVQVNQQQNKRILVEKYLLQLTVNNNYIYIGNATDILVAISRIGYLGGAIQLATIDIDPIQLKLKYGATGLKDSTGNDIILDADGLKQGIHTVKGPQTITKKNSAFEIISILFDRFIMFQKYIITRQILN